MTELESLKQQKNAIDHRIKELELRSGEQWAQDLAKTIASEVTLASIQGRVLSVRSGHLTPKYGSWDSEDIVELVGGAPEYATFEIKRTKSIRSVGRCL